MNVLNHELFRKGQCNTGFIEQHPELFNISALPDRELRVLNFLGNKAVNENKGVKPDFDVPVFPRIPEAEIAKLMGTKQIFDKEGPEKFSQWILDQKGLLITDTTMRDAQQSLMATRVRTVDMEKIAAVLLITAISSSRRKCGVELRLTQRIDLKRIIRGKARHAQKEDA